jgi:hypothetical protein
MSAGLESKVGASAKWELRFQPLLGQGSCLSFPYDEQGNVSMDSLDSQSFCNYLFARGMIGKEFAQPCVIGLARG